MKKRSFLIIGLFVATMLLIGYKVNGPASIMTTETQSTKVNLSDTLTPEAVKEDFEYFMGLIKYDYPYLGVNERLNGVDFLENEGRYWQRIKTAKTRGEFATKLNSIISELNNGHTSLIPVDEENKTRDLYYRIYGSIVQKGGSLGINYKPWVETLERQESLNLYGPLPVLDKNGQNETASQGSVMADNITTQVLENGKIAYMKVRSFNYFNEQADKEQVFAFIKANLKAKALIIDIRENGGGSTDYFKNLLVEPLLKKPLTITRYNLMRLGTNNKAYIEAIEKANPGALRPISELNPEHFPKAQSEVFTLFDYYIKDTMTYRPQNSMAFEGNIYLLVSNRVYSASEAFASFCKDTGFATLVGQQTGGDGYGTDPALFCLPNSGIIGRYPLQYGMMASGEANEEVKTQPDFVVDKITVMENLALDPCIQTIIALEQ